MPAILPSTLLNVTRPANKAALATGIVAANADENTAGWSTAFQLVHIMARCTFHFAVEQHRIVDCLARQACAAP